VFYLVRRNGEALATFGLDTGRIGKDIAFGVFAGLSLLVVGALGYIAVLNIGIQRTLLSAPPLGHWWGLPLVLLGSLGAGALEETVMVGYLLPRLEQLGWAVPTAVVASALFRGSYHLYQGPGGAIGAVAMGLVFGWAFNKWRRTWPLITAHFVYDAAGALLYASVKGHCLLSTCIR
jgi:membrane protease YdiL (CAAX protease family)